MLSVNTSQESISVRNNYYALQKTTHSSFERLSSGLRINGAKDDAAGLSISTRMNADIRGIQSSIQNATNWISLFQTAESGLNEITSMIQRIRELTVQANNATYTDSDRASMQAEVDQLVKEIDHISEGTVFNGLKILNGDIKGSVMQLGVDSGETESVYIDKLNASNIGRGIIVGPNNRVNTNVALSGMQIAKDGEVVTVRDTSASDDLLSTTRNANSALAKIAAINAASSALGISAIARDSKLESVNAVSQTTLDESNYLIINDEKISGFTVQDNDADGSLIDAINAVSEDTGVIASLNETNQLLLTADDGRNIELNVVGLANFAGIVGSTVAGGKVGIVSDDAFEMRNMAGAAGNGVAVGGGGDAAQGLGYPLRRSSRCTEFIFFRGAPLRG